jgi:WD40 repeat protein
MHRLILLFLTFANLALLAQTPELVVQNGHTNLIQAATISSDSKWLATAGIDQTIKVWDIASGKLIKSFDNGEAIYDMAFLGDNQRLLSSGYGNDAPAITFWSMASDSMLAYMDVSGGAISLDMSEHFNYVAVSTSSGYVYVWNQNTGDLIHNFKTPHLYSLQNVVVSEEKNIVIASSSDIVDTNYIYIWDLENGEMLNQFPVQYDIENLLLLNDSSMLVEIAQWGAVGIVYKMNFKTGAVLDSFNLSNASLINNKTQIVGQEKAFQMAVYDIATGKVIKKFPTKIEYSFETIASPDESVLVIMNQDFEMINLKNFESMHLIKGRRWIDGLSFAANASKLAFSGVSGEIINWDLETGDIDIWEGHKNKIEDIYYHRNGEVLASVGLDSSLIIYNNKGEKLHTIAFRDNNFCNITMTTDAKWLTLGIKDTIHSILVETGERTPPFSFWGRYPDKIAYSPNGKDFTAILYNSIINYDLSIDSIVLVYQTDGGLKDLSFSYDGKYIATGGYSDSLLVIEMETGKLMYSLENGSDYVTSVAFDPTSYLLAVGYQSGITRLIDVATSKIVGEHKAHGNQVSKISFKGDGKIMASASWDGKLILWDVKPFRKKAELYVFKDQSWAVIDEVGRYDASNGGNIDALHFVVQNEAIALEQLKQRYYEPGLLQKLLGYSKEELRDVQQLKDVRLFANANLRLEDKDKLSIALQDRGGGIGQVQFFINNKEIIPDISYLLVEFQEGIYLAEIDLKPFRKYFKSDGNQLAIKVFNKENYLSGPKVTVQYDYVPPTDMPSGFSPFVKVPALHAIVIGTADYRGVDLDLKYADKDAATFSNALLQSGAALFGMKNTYVHLLSTETGNKISSKENIKTAFYEVAKLAGPGDALVVYLSGHGMNYQNENEAQFYYLTKDLENSNLADAAIRNAYAISTAELTEWINQIPAEKQVLILDACASGKAIEDIMVNTKGISSSQIRALERMKDRTGMFVLAGSTSDQVSYEASQYGQSLLTYSLLSGMKGQALRENEFVDVAKLFEHSVDHVPTLAEYIGGVQKPILAIPFGGTSFDIGRIDETVMIELPSVKPIFIRSNFQDEFEFADVLGLSVALDSELRNIATKGNQSEIIFVDVNKYPKAYSIKGRYTITDELVKITAKVFNDTSVVGEFIINGNKNDIAALSEMVLSAAYKVLEE